MMILPLAMLLSTAPPGEDAVHRADRLRTEQLNRQAAAVVARRDRSNGMGQSGYGAARARYEADMAAWRRQVAACENGDYSACAR